ncbi:hypothetical protein M3Y94_00749100 [Aphelenchoides besseyi]|nr:hypothetical protein M3Y94_00749100 [Aphelenchoides besseyi]KAI6232053.1 hypothetical protein M3Y95_00446300 [Aphelenchoides besseyi]
MIVKGTKGLAGLLLLSVFWSFCAHQMEAREIRVLSDNDTYNCLYCTAKEGICPKTCAGKYCVKAIDLTSHAVRRYCMKYLEPHLPEPGQCKVFSAALDQSEEICVCEGNQCNSSSVTVPSLACASVLMVTWLTRFVV